MHLKYDISELEQKAAAHLPTSPDELEDARTACDYFAAILNHVFRSVGKGHPHSEWCLDDLWCQRIELPKKKHSRLSGIPYWLSGGDNCEVFRIDVGLDTVPMLYSYKFLVERRARQVLYVAKMREEWVLRAT